MSNLPVSDFAFDAITVTFVPFLMEKFRAGMLLTITGYANMLKYRKKNMSNVGYVFS